MSNSWWRTSASSGSPWTRRWSSSDGGLNRKRSKVTNNNGNSITFVSRRAHSCTDDPTCMFALFCFMRSCVRVNFLLECSPIFSVWLACLHHVVSPIFVLNNNFNEVMVWGSLGTTQIVKTEVCIWCAVYFAANSLPCQYSPRKPHNSSSRILICATSATTAIWYKWITVGDADSWIVWFWCITINIPLQEHTYWMNYFCFSNMYSCLHQTKSLTWKSSLTDNSKYALCKITLFHFLFSVLACMMQLY